MNLAVSSSKAAESFSGPVTAQSRESADGFSSSWMRADKAGTADD